MWQKIASLRNSAGSARRRRIAVVSWIFKCQWTQGWCLIYQVNICTIVSFHWVKFIVLLCNGQGSLLCSLWRNLRLVIHLVYRAPAEHSPKSLNNMLYDGVLTNNATSNRDYNRSPLNNFEYTREKVSISWENLDVFVKVPQPSLRKRLHLITEEQEKPTRKQVLYNRKYLFYLSI